MLDRARAGGEHRVGDAFHGRPLRGGRRWLPRARRARQRGDGEDRTIDIEGAFIAIGHRPNSDIVEGQVDMDEDGYVEVEGRSTRTTCPACSPRVTWSTAPTARPSPQRAPAVPRRSMLRRTCATRPRSGGPLGRRPRQGRGCRGSGRRLAGHSRAVPQLWTNWAREQRCAPNGSRARPPRGAGRARARRPRPPPYPGGGIGHSFTDCACTDGVMVDLGAMTRVVEADAESGLVTVESGITLHELGKQLAARGLAMENQGDIDRQTLAGAISTATHGTGEGSKHLVPGGRPETDHRRRQLGRHRGARPRRARGGPSGDRLLGAIATVTLQAVPIFTIERGRPRPLAETLERLDERGRRGPLRAVHLSLLGHRVDPHQHP